jgi:hypothetical protein
MRPRAIKGVPGLKPKTSPFERLEQFARKMVSVPKEGRPAGADGPGT